MSSIEKRATAAFFAHGVFTARLVGFAANGAPLVAQADADALPARSIVSLEPDALGSEVVIAYEAGDWSAPLVLGLIQPARPLPHALRLSAAKSIEISCGKSSIVLHADGRLVLRGEYVLSRARRTNRIEGGAVQIN